jgi:hypothetical protein
VKRFTQESFFSTSALAHIEIAQWKTPSTGAIPGCRFAHPGYALFAAIMRMRTS